ncbi:MAG: tRNA (adenosine(37)-N6)-threonylcarbamoyltransferase complex dimerization subunit type 1 TsaB [Clostridia bacterium]|nr:tRNA (adenosine(37)-N6)-threonylcarbamoyltransferase complex dimerization subunit type 1 TsaB [Clostridia bacterium]
MRILGIESSAKAASVCMWDDGKILCETFSNNGLTHSKTVLSMIQDMMRQSDISIDSIDKIAISAGPGSFTGLRIGAAVVQGLSWSKDIPCVGVSTLEAMVQNVRGFDGLLCPVMDARAGQVYQASFKWQDGEIVRVCDDRAITIADLDTEIKNEERVVLLGDGAELCYKNLTHTNLCLTYENVRYPRAWGVCEVAKDKEGSHAYELKLEYLRKPQAERERLARLNKE